MTIQYLKDRTENFDTIILAGPRDVMIWFMYRIVRVYLYYA